MGDFKWCDNCGKEITLTARTISHHASTYQLCDKCMDEIVSKVKSNFLRIKNSMKIVIR
jgi:ribosome-binding protein aMBF1 (putative translation factor)